LLEAFICGGLWAFFSLLSGDIIGSFIDSWIENVIEYICLIGFPYFIAIFYLNYKEKNQMLKNLLTITIEEKIDPESIVSFMEISGVEKMKIPLKNILYLESSDNYVSVYCIFDQKIEKYILRNTLKKFEEKLRPYNLMRCHRSYIINPLKVNSQIKTTKGLSLKLKTTPEIVIPVSKPYVSEFQKHFK
jgi:DNA-binding LytR/AlgR family response regulator